MKWNEKVIYFGKPKVDGECELSLFLPPDARGLPPEQGGCSPLATNKITPVLQHLATKDLTFTEERRPMLVERLLTLPALRLWLGDEENRTCAVRVRLRVFGYISYR